MTRHEKDARLASLIPLTAEPPASFVRNHERAQVRRKKCRCRSDPILMIRAYTHQFSCQGRADRLYDNEVMILLKRSDFFDRRVGNRQMTRREGSIQRKGTEKTGAARELRQEH